MSALSDQAIREPEPQVTAPALRQHDNQALTMKKKS